MQDANFFIFLAGFQHAAEM